MAGKIILASSSPRRADILKNANIKFSVIPSEYEEDHTVTVFSYDYVENLAYNKALDVAKRIKEKAIVIGADTIVVLDDEILGKPDGYNGAFDMLKKLSGKTHKVVTAIVLIDTETLKCSKQSVTSEVTFEILDDEKIDFYIQNYKPFDKAGSYGIQEMPKGYIKNYTGDLENIIGISSKAVIEMLAKF